ncbi:MAG: hypothetical protein KGH75_00970 [Rhodospirillales bacterium]|nr:hypothetical protein [Rhodospirillales bacterium]
MAWTDTQLAAAYSALTSAPATLADAVTALNAQTTNITIDVPVGTIYGNLLLTGVWAQMVAWAKANPSDTTGALAVIDAMQAMLTSPNIPDVTMSNPTTAALISGMLAKLVSSSVITQTQEAAILALASATVAVWQPAVIISDLQRVQRAGGIPASVPPYPGYVAP